MSVVHLEVSDPTVSEIIRAAFPEYTGKRVRAIVSETVAFHGTQWDEGNKRDYVAVRLSDCLAQPVAQAPYFRESIFHTGNHQIPNGFVVVCHDQCGTRASIEIISPASNIDKLLPPPVELTADEERVLVCTRSYKSSYGGLSNYRFHQSGLSRTAWDTAKASLIAKKLLNKAGALTTAGKNAIEGKRA